MRKLFLLTIVILISACSDNKPAEEIGKGPQTTVRFEGKIMLDNGSGECVPASGMTFTFGFQAGNEFIVLPGYEPITVTTNDKGEFMLNDLKESYHDNSYRLLIYDKEYFLSYSEAIVLHTDSNLYYEFILHKFSYPDQE